MQKCLKFWRTHTPYNRPVIIPGVVVKRNADTAGPGHEARTAMPDFPPRADMNNPIYLYDPGYPTAVRRCLGFHEDTLVQAEVPLGWHSTASGEES